MRQVRVIVLPSCYYHIAVEQMDQRTLRCHGQRRTLLLERAEDGRVFVSPGVTLSRFSLSFFSTFILTDSHHNNNNNNNDIVLTLCENTPWQCLP